MPFLYRTAIIVSRKQPYIDWANSLRESEADGFPLELAGKRDVYLGPHVELQQTLDEAVSEVWPDIFDEELFGWSTDEAQWPQDRSRELFDAWFECELADTIVDLVPEDPLTDDDMDVIDVEEAMHHCAWCGSELADGQGRMVSFGLPEEDRFDDREGRILRLVIKKNRVVTGVVTPRDSTPAEEGADLIFPACSRPCEKRLFSVVPRALDQLQRDRAARQHPPR